MCYAYHSEVRVGRVVVRLGKWQHFRRPPPPNTRQRESHQAFDKPVAKNVPRTFYFFEPQAHGGVIDGKHHPQESSPVVQGRAKVPCVS